MVDLKLLGSEEAKSQRVIHFKWVSSGQEWPAAKQKNHKLKDLCLLTLFTPEILSLSIGV